MQFNLPANCTLVVHIEDEDNDSFFGYQQLPQDEEDGWEPLESDNEEEEETQGPLNIRLDPSQKIDAGKINRKESEEIKI